MSFNEVFGDDPIYKAIQNQINGTVTVSSNQAVDVGVYFHVIGGTVFTMPSASSYNASIPLVAHLTNHSSGTIVFSADGSDMFFTVNGLEPSITLKNW